MASAVFLRGVNVGGDRLFKPAALAKEMAALGVVNVGAAGTFVVRAQLSASKLRDEFCKRLPFETDVMVCAGREIVELVRAAPFDSAGLAELAGEGVTRYVSVLDRAPRPPAPALPVERPEGASWQV